MKKPEKLRFLIQIKAAISVPRQNDSANQIEELQHLLSLLLAQSFEELFDAAKKSIPRFLQSLLTELPNSGVTFDTFCHFSHSMVRMRVSY